jgi:hypothetical protein
MIGLERFEILFPSHNSIRACDWRKQVTIPLLRYSGHPTLQAHDLPSSHTTFYKVLRYIFNWSFTTRYPWRIVYESLIYSWYVMGLLEHR